MSSQIHPSVTLSPRKGPPSTNLIGGRWEEVASVGLGMVAKKKILPLQVIEPHLFSLLSLYWLSYFSLWYLHM